jgi:hypothetical protein
MKIPGLIMSKHHFSLLVFMLIKKYFPHHKFKDEYRTVVFYNGDYFGIFTCFLDKTIKIFYKGACIQYFTSLNDFENWIKNGCSKETLFMMKNLQRKRK